MSENGKHRSYNRASKVEAVRLVTEVARQPGGRCLFSVPVGCSDPMAAGASCDLKITRLRSGLWLPATKTESQML